MKKLAFILAALTATPALAHQDAHQHLHPHGFEGMIGLALVLGLIYFIGRAK